MDDIFTNDTGPGLVRNAFYRYASEATTAYLAAPFFSYSEILEPLVAAGVVIRLIVRLGPSTDPDALGRTMGLERTQVRFFTSRRFHSKLYIFDPVQALVGSANLTHAGTTSNQEVAIGVGPRDERFDRLVGVFQGYWDCAQVLSDEALESYSRLYREAGVSVTNPLERTVVENFGDLAPTGIRVGGSRPPAEKVWLEAYRRTYQEFLEAFRRVEARYQLSGKRMQPEDRVPRRIEIDMFLSFIREKYTRGDDYEAKPLRSGADQDSNIDEHLEAWFGQRWAYLDSEIPPKYALVVSALGSVDKIKSASLEDLFDALDVCHSVHDRLRFFRGGHPVLRKEFLRQNEENRVQQVLSFLLYGGGNFIERMGTCIFDPGFQLNQFGRSAVQELLGWVNQENIPICNGRTVKSLRYLGFDVRTDWESS